MPSASPVPANAPTRALVAVLAASILLAACSGPDPTGSADATGSPDPAGSPDAGSPEATGSPDPVSSEPTAATGTETTAAAPTTNLTDGCVDQPGEGTDYFPDKLTFDEATGVRVTYEPTYKVVEVTPPALPDAEPLRYVLSQCGLPAPELAGDLAGAQVIEVPAQDIITLTTTNLPHFAELDTVDHVVGVGTGAFVSTEPVLERIQAGEIPDYADETGQPDLERLVGADPDLLLVDGFGDTVLDDVGRFIDSGLPTAINADFNEQTLLGRAEWLKFTALFLNAEADASAAYEGIATAYAEVAKAVAGAEERPTVLVNTPFEGTWFVPGGASFQAAAIADAGGDYAFADDDSTGALSLDIETVLAQAGEADVWLQAGSVNGTLDDLAAQDERLTNFAAFANGEVYAYDKLTTAGGGNAVFELAYTRADLFLADLAAILHPELLADHDTVFFGKVGSGG